MALQPGKQTITIHIIGNISGSKGNQAMKFGQLIAYSMRNNFFENSYTKGCGEILPDPFLKNQTWEYF